MSPRFSLVGFETIGEQVGLARGWLEDLGIATSGTRIEAIEERVDGVVSALSLLEAKALALGRSVDRERALLEVWDRPETYYALADGAAFGRVWAALREWPSHRVPRQELKKVLGGPLVPTSETPDSTEARNLFVELELAADLIEKGIRVSGFGDVRFDFEDVEFAVQCKRPFSAGNLRLNTEKAASQLTTDFEGAAQRGFIALAIDKVMDLDHGIVEARDGAEVEAYVRGVYDEFKARFGTPWSNVVDPRILGVLLITRFLVRTESQNVIGPAYYASFVPIVDENAFEASERERVLRLVSSLRESTGQLTEELY